MCSSDLLPNILRKNKKIEAENDARSAKTLNNAHLGYTRLYSDPCAYIRCDGNNASIITVWVDDLLLFTSADDLMRKMKEEIKASWDVTDMGEPKKIIGIEISHVGNTVTISQQRHFSHPF